MIETDRCPAEAARPLRVDATGYGLSMTTDDASQARTAPIPPPVLPTTSSNGAHWFASMVAGICVLIAGGVWGYVIPKLAELHEDVDAVSSNPFLDASAVQISQLANQAMVEQLSLIGLGLGVSITALTLAVAVNLVKR